MKRLVLLAVASCSTLASEGHGDSSLPTAGVGPFRPLTGKEDTSIVPFVFTDSKAIYREPSVLAATGDPSSASVVMYAVARDAASGHDVIVRSRADDGRSFYATSAAQPGSGHVSPPVVVKADRPWEGFDVSGPSALRVGDETWLYYAAAGGIGLAKSSDGLTFGKKDVPALAWDKSDPLESTAPHAPSVARFPDGTFHMLYAAGDSIGEATSADGTSFTRVADNPVLAPGGGAAAQVGDPLLAPRVQASGRLLVRVLYTSWDPPSGAAARNSSIRFAGRFGDSGPLAAQSIAVYSAQAHEQAPALFEWSQGSMLYVHQDQPGDTTGTFFTAIAAAVAPASIVLPPPLAFPDSP